jgi:hypothetical protein
MPTFLRSLATAVALAAIAAPLAAARPIPGPLHVSEPAAPPPAADGFHWDDAAVGAGGVLGALTLVGGGVLVLRRAAPAA